MKDNHKIGTLGAYAEAEIDPSTNIGLNLLKPEIFEETDHIFSQLGTGSDSKFSCIVIKLSQKADFSQIQMVILP